MQQCSSGSGQQSSEVLPVILRCRQRAEIAHGEVEAEYVESLEMLSETNRAIESLDTILKYSASMYSS